MSAFLHRDSEDLFGYHPECPNEDLVRQSYEQVVESGARLLAFATSTGSDLFSTDIGFGLKKLAKHDLVQFSIAARRMIEATGFQDYARHKHLVKVKVRRALKRPHITCTDSINLMTVISKLIHSRELVIANNEWDLRPVPLGELIETRHYGFKVPGFETVCWLESDVGDPFAFAIIQLLGEFDEVLNCIIDYCDDHSIELQD